MCDKYFGSFDSYATMVADFKIPPDQCPSEEDVIFASYGTPSYRGDAMVLFQKDGQLYENYGSHCSCYGLEDQWSPEPTTWPVVINNLDNTIGSLERNEHTSEAIAQFIGIVLARQLELDPTSLAPEPIIKCCMLLLDNDKAPLVLEIVSKVPALSRNPILAAVLKSCTPAQARTIFPVLATSPTPRLH